MNDTNTGGPAFPGVSTNPDGDPYQPGMALRDYFAAKAMQSLLELHHDVMRISDQDGWVTLHLRAYEHADAMLKARSV